MSSINPLFSSSSASHSMMQAFMAQSKASVLQNLSFFSGNDPTDMVDFSQTALQSSMFMSIMQGGNSAVFGGVYKNAEAFNQSLMTSVSEAAGFHFGAGDSLLGQLVNQMA